LLNGQLSDRNWGDFVQSVLSYDPFEALYGIFFFKKDPHAKSKDKSKDNDDNRFSEFFGAF
jgi:hypothetical protein